MSEPLKAVWLLDIDGVVNALKPTKTEREFSWPGAEWVEGRADTFGGDQFPITASVPLLEYIRRVHAENLVEIRWLTTWGSGAEHLCKLLDLPMFPVQLEPPANWRDHRLIWWKLPEARKVFYSEQRPVIWTDDDAAWYVPRGTRRSLRRDGMLLITPSEHHGLTATDVEAVDRYIMRSHTDVRSTVGTDGVV